MFLWTFNRNVLEFVLLICFALFFVFFIACVEKKRFEFYLNAQDLDFSSSSCFPSHFHFFVFWGADFIIEMNSKMDIVMRG